MSKEIPHVIRNSYADSLEDLCQGCWTGKGNPLIVDIFRGRVGQALIDYCESAIHWGINTAHLAQALQQKCDDCFAAGQPSADLYFTGSCAIRLDVQSPD